MLLGNCVCSGWTYSVQQVVGTSLGGSGFQTNYSIWPWILYVVLKVIIGLKVVGILLHLSKSLCGAIGIETGTCSVA
jgi:hypothetical protein